MKCHENDVRAPECSVIADRILKVSRRLAAVDEVFAFVLHGGSAPKALGSASILNGCHERAGRYARDYYRFDPMIDAGEPDQSSEFTKRVIDTSQIARSDYRAVCFEEPRLRQKISFEHKSDALRLVCNFYLRKPVGRVGIHALEDVAAVTLPSLLQLAARGADRAGLIQRLEGRLLEAYPLLTARERQVCARTMAGWPAESIAAELGVAAGSVLTYRRRAYARYGYSSAGAFLERVVN